MDSFLAVLGHDLRGRLASLSNCVQLQCGAGQAPEARDRVSHIATRSIALMDEMITDLLEYTKTRLGRGMDVSPRPGNLGALCAEILEEIRAARPGVRIEYEGARELAAVFDRARIHQVLFNLLNAAPPSRQKHFRSSSNPWCRWRSPSPNPTSGHPRAWVWVSSSPGRSCSTTEGALK